MGVNLKDRRAVSSVIGAIFLIAVLSLSMVTVFSYQGHFAVVTHEGMKAQQAVTEQVRENLEVTLLARSQNGDSATLQIENNGLVTAEVTRIVIKDPDTGRSQILPLTCQLTLLPNEKRIVTVSIPNGNGNEKIGLITGRGKLYGAVPTPRTAPIQSTTTGETNLNNPQPLTTKKPSKPSRSTFNPIFKPVPYKYWKPTPSKPTQPSKTTSPSIYKPSQPSKPTPSKPSQPTSPSPISQPSHSPQPQPNQPSKPTPSKPSQLSKPTTAPSPSPSPSPQPSQLSTPVSEPQPPTPQKEEGVSTTRIPLRSNPYIEKTVEYVTEQTTKTVKESDTYIWKIPIPGEPRSTTYTMTVHGERWMDPVVVSRTERTSSKTRTFKEGSEPSLGDFVRQQLRDLAIQTYGEDWVKSQEALYRNNQAFRMGQGGQSLWWINWKNYVVSGSLESGTVTLRVPTTLLGTATVTFTKQTTPGTKPSWMTVETHTPEPPAEKAELIDRRPGKTATVTETTTRAVERQVQTGTTLTDSEGNAWNVFRDPKGKPVLVKGSPRKTGEYTVKTRDANGNIVWLRPEDAEKLADVATGQAENPGAIGGQLPGTPQFDENGNLMGFVKETSSSARSTRSSSSSSSSNSYANQIRSSGVAVSGGIEAAASYVESHGISNASDLAAAYAAATGASYSEVLATIESNPGTAAGIAAFLAANS